MRVCISDIRPRIKEIAKSHQGHASSHYHRNGQTAKSYVEFAFIKYVIFICNYHFHVLWPYMTHKIKLTYFFFR